MIEKKTLIYDNGELIAIVNGRQLTEMQSEEIVYDAGILGNEPRLLGWYETYNEAERAIFDYLQYGEE